ncbi:MAG: hypothetical protein ACYC8T_32165, partial [Myxococcaceae bacterium]
RALLEAAEDQGTAAALVMSSAIAAIREEEPNVFPESPVAKTPKRPPPVFRPPPADTAEQPALAPAHGGTTQVNAEPPQGGGRTWLWTLALLAFTLAAGFFSYKLIMTPGMLPEGEAPAPVKELPRFPGAPLPEYGAAPKGVPASGKAPSAAADAGELPVRVGRPVVGARTGALTLVTTPSCTVLRGKQVVGTTPLFNAVLPAGTHKLTLQGADGSVRVLSAPITAGKTTSFRLKLADLPEK